MSRNGGITRKEFLWRSAGIAALAGVGVGGLVRCSGTGQGGENGPVEIEYWHINTEAFGGPTVKELVARFQELNPDITVVERFQNGDYTGLIENLQTSLVSKDPPDVAQIGYLYLNYVTENFPYVSVEKLVRDYGEDGFYDSVPENILELGRVDGEQAGMPYSVSNAVMYYNADMLSQAGLDPDAPPQTWEDWHEATRRIDEELDKPGLWIYTLDDNWGTQAMIESNGGRMLGCEGGEAVAAFDGPEAVEAIRFWADMIQEGVALNALYEEGTQAFLTRGVAAAVDTIADRGNFQEQASFDLRATAFPSFGGREPRLPAGGNNLFVFSQDEAKQRAALRFIEFLVSPESLSTWTRGLGYIPIREGVNEDPRYLGDFIEENPVQRVAIEQTPLVVPWASFPGPDGLEASKTLFSAIQEILGGESEAEDGLSRAADEVNRSIEGQRCL
jgi:multiple sugar transport system substrate-binding protein